MQNRRVVCTGIGVLSALGSNLESFSKNLFDGQSAIRRYPSDRFLPAALHLAAGCIPDFDPGCIDYDQKILARCDLFIAYALHAAFAAIKHSGLNDNLESYDRMRAGVCFGSGIGGLSTIEEQYRNFLQKGPKGVSPFFIPSTLVNMPAGHIAMRYGWTGPNLALATACTTSAHAIAQGFEIISSGQADLMLVGGAEYSTTPFGMSGFAAARALASCPEDVDPVQVSRPLDRNRTGFVMADGSAALVLESLEHAQRRGAPILAEVLGVGLSADAFHMTQPHPEGLGAQLAMQKALERARLDRNQIDIINPHATGTVAGDIAELKAIESIFAGHHRLMISPTKGSTGHLLGAAGALEAVISILCLHKQHVPPAKNLHDPEELTQSFVLPNAHLATHKPSQIIMSNSFAFGGTNASLIFSTPDLMTE